MTAQDTFDEPEARRWEVTVWLAIWRTGVQLFNLVVIMAIFAGLHTALAQLITGLAGILYCTIRTGQILQGIFMGPVYAKIALDLEQIRHLINGTAPPTNPAEVNAEIAKAKTPMYFQAVGTSLAFFLCLYEVYGAVSGGQI